MQRDNYTLLELPTIPIRGRVLRTYSSGAHFHLQKRPVVILDRIS